MSTASFSVSTPRRRSLEVSLAALIAVGVVADLLESTAVSRAFEEAARGNGSKGSGGDLVRRPAEGNSGDAGADQSHADERELAVYEPVWDVLCAAVWRGDDDVAGGNGCAETILVGGRECTVRGGGWCADGGVHELRYSGGPESAGWWGEHAADGGGDDQFAQL